MHHLNGTVCNLGERYEALKFMGCGDYGSYIKALDKRTNEFVLIQKVHKIENLFDAQKVLRGLRILRLFKHENIIELRNVIFNQDPKEFGAIFLITNLMEIDLNVVCKNSKALTDDHIQFVIYQIVRALLCLHSAGIIHGRLRPLNILASETCDIQLSDFGRSRSVFFNSNENDDENTSDFPSNRYYRAPEILISREYSTVVDMWNVGCIMAELITGDTLFRGENYIQEIRSIVETLGKPKDMSFVTSKHAKKFLDTLSEIPKRPLLSVVRYDNDDALDLLSKLLEIDPRKRITAAEAIVHPYLRAFHEPTDEPVFTGELDFQFKDEAKLTMEETLLAIVDEVNYWKKQNNEDEVDKEKFNDFLKSKSSLKDAY